MSHEIELKLEVAPGATKQLMRQSWLNGAKRKSQRQLSVYFDTPEGELRERGYSLRVRSVGDHFFQTVKSLDTGAGLLERGEWEWEIEGAQPDLTVLASTPLAGIDTGRLEAVVSSDVNRTACRLTPEGAEVELDVDRGIMFAGGRELSVSEVEIELIRGEPSSVMSLARRIAEEVSVKLGVMSKAERGFALATGALDQATKAEPVVVQPDMSVAEAFEMIVTACVRHFRLNEPLVIHRRVPEALHQARVAVRRLGAAFALFRSAVADDEFARLRDEFRWFIRQLGDARNLDVYLRRTLPVETRQRLERKRQAAYDLAIAAMESERFRWLILDLVVWASFGTWRKGAKAKRRLEPYVRRRIDRQWKKISGTDGISGMKDERRHRLRIRIKKFRYSLEFMDSLYGQARKRKKKSAEAVKELQEALGQLNDMVVARSFVLDDVCPTTCAAPGEEQRRHVRKASRAINRMRKAGPYWRAKVA